VNQPALVRQRHRFGTADGIELGENGFHMRLGGALGDLQAPADVLVAASLGQLLQHIELALRETGADHALQCFRCDGAGSVGLVCSHRADGVEDFLARRVLQQITLGAAAQAFEEEPIETESFSLVKPEGFLSPVENEDFLAFYAYSKEFGEEDKAEKLRQSLIKLKVLAGRSQPR